mmetsp:Transcript_97273/g.302897  ORF Transcript_97273/g.302897 Transcript_97273/m.302897 type:complete len:418 (+) Transcript_97273:1331-2584(+)
MPAESGVGSHPVRETPRGWELGARVADDEALAEEVRLPLPLDLRLLLHQLLQLAHVPGAGVRAHEELTLGASVGEAGVEDPLQEGPLLVLGGAVGVQVGPEVPAAGGARARLGAAAQARGLGEVELLQAEVHALGPDACSSRLGGPLQDVAALRDELEVDAAPDERPALRGEEPGPGGLLRGHEAGKALARSDVEATEAELHAAIETDQIHVGTLLCPGCRAVHWSNLRVAAVLPQLGYFQATACRCLLHRGPIHQAEPVVINVYASFHDELGKDGCLCNLSEVIDHALPFRNEIEVVSECRRILDHGVVRPGHGDVCDAVLAELELPSFHAHLDMRHQHVALSHEDLCIVDHKPSASRPLFSKALGFREVEGALHADYRLLVLSERQLLQVVICLEHGFTQTRAHQPLRFEPLRLH